MKHLVLLLAILVVIATTVVIGYKGVIFAASQSETTFPQKGDLCGGTGGNGQVVNLGNKAFTMQRNDDGSNQIIHLTDQASIKTLNGSISLSHLKTGMRVTLVGGPNPDGSFTADNVFVCNSTSGNRIGQVLPSTEKKRNTDYKNVSELINILTVILIGLGWLGAILFLRSNKKKSFVYLLFFTIFYIYLYKVIDYTLLQFQSLLLLQHFVPGLMLNGIVSGKSLNLTPLATLTLKDVKTSLLNIIMMIPFGFGLPFITNFRMKKVVIAGFLLSVAIEFLQLLTGFMANTTFRVADINDLIFNTIGAAIGYVLFVGFARSCHIIFHNRKISNPILLYIFKRPQIK